MGRVRHHFSIIMRGIKTIMEIEKAYIFLHLMIEAATPFTPYLNIYMLARIINELAGNKDVNVLIFYTLLTIGLNLVISLTLSGLNHLKNYHQNHFYINRDMHFSKKSMSMDYENVENRDIHLLHERIKLESQSGYNEFQLITSAGSFIRGIVSVTLAFALSLDIFISKDVAVSSKLLLLLLMVAVISINYVTTRKTNKLALEMFDKHTLINGFSNFYADFCFDYSSGKDVRLYAMENFVSSEMEKLSNLSHKISVATAKTSLKYNILNAASDDAFRISAYIFVALACLVGGVSIGDVARYVGCMVMAVGSFTIITRSMQVLVDNNKYLERYFSFLDIPSKMYQGMLSVKKSAGDEYELEFHNVSFKYPGAYTYAIKNLCLKINVGLRMAVVGMNGSGKTTMIKLLCRLYDPTEGVITLNGVDIKEYDHDEYLSIFSVVFQDFKLFSFTLGQNVSASVEYDGVRVEKCLELAGLKERFGGFFKGCDTPLYKDFDENGVEVSGGEAQKIALAKALYKDAPFIVLDEPTAALDPIAELEVYTRFNKIIGSKTAIFISHRLSSCCFCDYIVVFHEGNVVQRGSHDALLASKERKYYELWNAQAQYYNEKMR